jgi:hypothetical protein
MNMFEKKFIRRLRAVLFYQFFRQITGINYFGFYGVKIFDQIGQNGALANMALSLGMVLGAVSCFWLIGTLGRKASIALGVMGQTVGFTTLVVMKLTESYGLLYPACGLYMFSFAIGNGAGSPLMVETIPNVGIGMAWGVGWIVCGCVGLFTPMMTDGWLGPTGTMMFYCFWCYVAIFALDYAIIETKGKQMDEVEQEYLNFKYRPFRLCPKNVPG